MHPPRLALLAGLLLVGCSAGWFLLHRGPRREIPFSHRTHARVNVPCDACHAGAGSGDRAGMPGKDVCLACHEPEEGAKDYERKIAEAAELRFPPWNRSPDVIFSHARHAARGIGCAECHGKVEETTELDDRVVARMEGCVACHRREADRCGLCHGSSSAARCDRCHAEMPPRDHTEFWRRRGHGFAADVDRERCATCHREDSCQRCHQGSVPASHGGAFGGRASNHCFSCHEPLQENACFVCHKGTPSHRRAAPVPGRPHPGRGSDCRECHLPGRQLPHADNGMSCGACHR